MSFRHLSDEDDIDPVTVTDNPSKDYELSGQIMLGAVVILFAIVIFMIFLHLYGRWQLLSARRRQQQRRNRQRRQNSIFYVDSGIGNPAVVSEGLDLDVMKSLPVFEFKEGLEVSECAVCLSEFVDGEKGRSLPKCSHSFHIECIDMWFASHSTCPLCRTPVEESFSEDGKSDEESRNENQVVVFVDSLTRTESEASFGSLVNESMILGRTSSSGASRRNSLVESKGFSIEIPTRSDASTESPAGRMISLRRILTRGLSMSSPITVEVSNSGACCDLETGAREETSLEPGRTQISLS